MYVSLLCCGHTAIYPDGCHPPVTDDLVWCLSCNRGAVVAGSAERVMRPPPPKIRRRDPNKTRSA